MIPPDLIDLSTASQISGRSRSTLKERIRTGKLAAWREGRELFVSRSQLARLFVAVIPSVEPGALKAFCDRFATVAALRGRARWHAEQRSSVIQHNLSCPEQNTNTM